MCALASNDVVLMKKKETAQATTSTTFIQAIFQVRQMQKVFHIEKRGTTWATQGHTCTHSVHLHQHPTSVYGISLTHIIPNCQRNGMVRVWASSHFQCGPGPTETGLLSDTRRNWQRHMLPAVPVNWAILRTFRGQMSKKCNSGG